MKKFQYTHTNGHDHCVKSRTITGRLTPKRYKVLNRYARSFNRANSALYGVSPRGYAYTCGCEHDCCGCMISTSMQVDVKTLGKYASVTLSVHESFNY